MDAPNSPNPLPIDRILQSLQNEFPSSGSLHDLQQLQAWASEQHDLALAIDCALIRSSCVSIRSKLPSQLLPYLITIGTSTGTWATDTVLDLLELKQGKVTTSLLELLTAGIALPWDRVISIMQQAQDGHLPDYIALYSHAPAAYQAPIIEQIWAHIGEHTVFGNLADLLCWIPTLPADQQTPFWHYIENKVDLSSVDHALLPAHLRPEKPVKSTIRAQRQLGMLTPQQLSTSDISTLARYIDLLPTQQQSLAYWGVSFHTLLLSEWCPQILKFLPQHETQACAKYIQSTDFVGSIQRGDPIDQRSHATINHIPQLIRNLLQFAQHIPSAKTPIIEKTLALLELAPHELSPDILQQLPTSACDHLAQTILQNAQTPPSFWDVLSLLPYLEQSRNQLADYAIQLIDQGDQYDQLTNYCRVLPFLSQARQQNIIELVCQQSAIIDSHYQACQLWIDLLPYLPNHQQQQRLPQLIATLHTSVSDRYSYWSLYDQLLKQIPSAADQIFQLSQTTPTMLLSPTILEYLQTEQRQQLISSILDRKIAHRGYLGHAIYPYLNQQQQQQVLDFVHQNSTDRIAVYTLLGFITIPNYPLLSLLPHIAQIPADAHRLLMLEPLSTLLPSHQLHLLMPLLNELPAHAQQPNYHHEPRWDSAKTWPQNIVAYILQNRFAQIEPYVIVYQRIDPNGKQQISTLLWQHIQANPQITIAEIAQQNSMLSYCVDYLNPQQIQAALDYLTQQIDIDHNNDWHIRKQLEPLETLIPYLNQPQLDQLFGKLALLPTNDFFYYYQTVIQYHPDYGRAYPTLLNKLSIPANRTATWDDLNLLTRAAPYLQTQHVQQLLLQSIQQLHGTIFQASIGVSQESFIAPIIALIHSNTLLNHDIMQQFIQHASQQIRPDCLSLLKLLLPSYLQTLAPEQQQQLAAQIYRSVEQITIAWP